MPAARVSGNNQPSIDFTLNLLGIRVWEDSCVLIAKSGWDWRPIGRPRRLPLRVPAQAEELRQADELGMTAYQLHVESPQLGIADLLAQQKPFAAALEDCSSCVLS
jgi:hypothetical protein